MVTGNNPLLDEIKQESLALTPGGRRGSGGGGKAGAMVEAGNMVMFNGAMLDIPSMIQRLDKSEKLKHDTDSRLKDLQEEMGT